MHLTLYRGATDPVPIRQDDFDSWSDVFDAIEDITRTLTGAPEGASAEEQKRQLLAFAPHCLREPYRRAKNVEYVSMLVLDVDRVADLDAMIARIDAPSIVYASPSDASDRRKVRVCTAIDSPITPRDCYETRIAYADRLGLTYGCGVERAQEAAKIFFAGRLHGTEEREIWRID